MLQDADRPHHGEPSDCGQNHARTPRHLHGYFEKTQGMGVCGWPGVGVSVYVHMYRIDIPILLYRP